MTASLQSFAVPCRTLGKCMSQPEIQKTSRLPKRANPLCWPEQSEEEPWEGRGAAGLSREGGYLASSLPGKGACPLPSRATRAVLWIPGRGQPIRDFRGPLTVSFPRTPPHPPEAHQTASICWTVDFLGAMVQGRGVYDRAPQLIPEPLPRPFDAHPSMPSRSRKFSLCSGC